MNFALSKSGFIHLTRWIAALLVVISHIRSFIFVDYKEVIQSNIFIKFFYFITGLGHQSVIVFFILSGYLIGSSVIKQIRNETFSYKYYLLSRLTRLYAVLIVALILTSLFDYIGHKVDTAAVYTGKAYFATLPFSVLTRADPSHFLTSLFMLQNTILPPFGSNGPLWSLANEFWYYLLFPLSCVIVFHLFLKRFSKRAFYVSLFFLICIVVVINRDISLYYLIWAIGLLPIYLKTKNKYLNIIIPVFLLAFLLLERSEREFFPPFAFDIIISILFAFWLTLFPDTKLENKFYKFNARMASFSYTLYLLHFPFSLLVLTIINSKAHFGYHMQPSLKAGATMISLVVLCIIFSFLVAYFTEFKTEKYKKVLAKALSIT